MSRRLYRKSDEERVVPTVSSTSRLPSEPYRTSWRRDYARLIHSAAFRRLQGKTQLFPNSESDFFRNRLTHSLEVAQVAKSIAVRLNHINPQFQRQNIQTDIVETAALCHDLGHPPFGHNGEEALDKLMMEDGGFEGNAQTLRILAKTEKRQTSKLDGDDPIPVDTTGKDCRVGLNLTYRTLASTLKYDKEIPQLSEARKEKKVQKGYYRTERDLVSKIKSNILGDYKPEKTFKTIECSIMDIADDISYSTYDLEDAFKANFLSPLNMIAASDEILEAVATEVRESLKKHPLAQSQRKVKFSSSDVINVLLTLFGSIFYLKHLGISGSAFVQLNIDARTAIASGVFQTSKQLSESGYFRSEITSHLVGRFIRGVTVKYVASCPPLSIAYLEMDTLKEVEVLKHFTYKSLIMSPMLKVVAYRGKDIVSDIFKALTSSHGSMLMPEDFRSLYNKLDDSSEKRRIVCDFVAGMTDNYAIEFHGRLYSTTPETIFKPI